MISVRLEFLVRTLLPKQEPADSLINVRSSKPRVMGTQICVPIGPLSRDVEERTKGDPVAPPEVCPVSA